MTELDKVYTICDEIHNKYRKEFCSLVDKLSFELYDELTKSGVELITKHEGNDRMHWDSKAKLLAIDRLISLFKSSFDVAFLINMI